MHARLQALRRARRREAEVEVDDDVARNHVGRAGAAVDVRHLPGGRREVGVAVVPLLGRQRGQRRYGQVDRVLGQVRIGDVALHAVDGQLARQRATPPVLDHVAERGHRGRLAHHAVVQPLAARAQQVADLDGAVVGRAFLVAGDQEADRAGVVRMHGDEFLGGHHEPGDRGFHVGGAAAIELAVAVGRLERVGAPLLHGAGRHHVGVAGEDQQLAVGTRAAALDGPQVGHAEVVRPADHGFALEAGGGQAFDQHILAALVFGRDGAAADQVFSEGKRGRHGGHGKWERKVRTGWRTGRPRSPR